MLITNHVEIILQIFRSSYGAQKSTFLQQIFSVKHDKPSKPFKSFDEAKVQENRC